MLLHFYLLEGTSDNYYENKNKAKVDIGKINDA
jgi:hypothetical protein